MNGIGIDLDFSAAAVAFGPPPILVFLIAVIVNSLLSGAVRDRLPLILRPLALADQLAGELERRLNREFRSAATRLIRGLILLLMLGAPAAIGAAILERAADLVPFVWLAELVVVAALVTPRTPLDDVRAVARAITAADLTGARIAARPMLGDAVERMDRLDLSAALIRQLGERIDSGFVAAAFWFVLLGLVGLAIYRVVSIVAARATSAEAQDVIFSFAATRLHEAIAIIPAFISGVLIAIASAFVPQASVGRAFASALRWPTDRPASRSWPGAVLARALGADATDAVHAAQTSTLLNRAGYLYALSVGFGFVLLALAALLRLST